MKNGVELSKKKEEPAKPKRMDAFDPYEFPPIEETVARYLSKDKFPRIIDSGDSLNKPGRKFEYTE